MSSPPPPRVYIKVWKAYLVPRKEAIFSVCHGCFKPSLSEVRPRSWLIGFWAKQLPRKPRSLPSPASPSGTAKGQPLALQKFGSYRPPCVSWVSAMSCPSLSRGPMTSRQTHSPVSSQAHSPAHSFHTLRFHASESEGTFPGARKTDHLHTAGVPHLWSWPAASHSRETSDCKCPLLDSTPTS